MRDGAWTYAFLVCCVLLLSHTIDATIGDYRHRKAVMPECRQWASLQNCLCWVRHECDPEYFGEEDTDGE